MTDISYRRALLVSFTKNDGHYQVVLGNCSLDHFGNLYGRIVVNDSPVYNWPSLEIGKDELDSIEAWREDGDRWIAINEAFSSDYEPSDEQVEPEVGQNYRFIAPNGEAMHLRVSEIRNGIVVGQRLDISGHPDMAFNLEHSQFYPTNA